MGVNLSNAKSIQGDVQIFGLVLPNDVVEACPAEYAADNDESERVPMPAVSMVRACLKSAGVMAPAASSPTRNTEPGSSSSIASIEGLDVDLIRHRLAGGPDYVSLDGKPTPWSANLAKAARGQPRPKPHPVAIEPVGNEVHLITSGNRRYHPEDAADASAVEPGSRVMVEACTTERMLFAESDALILQREMEFPKDQSES